MCARAACEYLENVQLIRTVNLTGNKIPELTEEMCSKMTSLEDLILNKNQLKVSPPTKQKTSG